MEMALHILDGLENGDAQNALYKLAVEKAGELSAEELCSSQAIGLLLKWLIRRNDKTVSGKVVEKFKQVDPSDLGVAIEKSLQYFRGTTANNENALVDEFARIISRRIEWLKKQVEAFDKPFSWAMPDAQFCDTKQVQDFLRGDDPIMQITKGIRKFKNFQDASNYAAKWKKEKQVGLIRDGGKLLECRHHCDDQEDSEVVHRMPTQAAAVQGRAEPFSWTLW